MIFDAQLLHTRPSTVKPSSFPTHVDYTKVPTFRTFTLEEVKRRLDARENGILVDTNFPQDWMADSECVWLKIATRSPHCLLQCNCTYQTTRVAAPDDGSSGVKNR